MSTVLFHVPHALVVSGEHEGIDRIRRTHMGGALDIYGRLCVIKPQDEVRCARVGILGHPFDAEELADLMEISGILYFARRRGESHLRLGVGVKGGTPCVALDDGERRIALAGLVSGTPVDAELGGLEATNETTFRVIRGDA